MLEKILAAVALVAFVFVAGAQPTKTNTDIHGAPSFTPSPTTITNSPSVNTPAINGRTLFLRNCAHCHGATAHGDDGPDLHNLDFTNDWIANRIRRGKAGEMTAFAGKLQPAEIAALVAYVQTLK